MLSEQNNARLTQVDPGTPMGDLLRRYWHPVAASSQIKHDGVRRVRLLGENLVLFSAGGTLGLVAERCPHRGCSLFFGIPEDKGLRCAYHGWLFAHDGTCLDQPAEHSQVFKDRVRARTYPVAELGGLVFAYLGPAPTPELPRFDLFAWDGALRHAGYTMLPANWLQIMENSLDPTHFEWLHGHFDRHVARRRGREPTLGGSRRHVKIGFDEFEFGIIKRRVVEGETEDDDGWRIGHPVVFPTMLKVGSGRGHYTFQIRVPVDDENTLIWWYACYRIPGVPVAEQQSVPAFEVPYLDDHGEFRVDSVEGQDMMAWVSQGAIADRTVEKLGSADRGITMFRKLLHQEMAKVEQGEDPIGVIRDPDRGVIDLPQEEQVHFKHASNLEDDIRRHAGMQFSPIVEDVIDLFRRDQATVSAGRQGGVE